MQREKEGFELVYVSIESNGRLELTKLRKRRLRLIMKPH